MKTTDSTTDWQAPASDQQALLAEARRRLDIRDGIDRHRITAQAVRRERLERITRFSERVPFGGNPALASSALIQAVLGVEFVLSSLNKLADSHYVADFAAFVRSTPGAMTGILAPLVQGLVLPNMEIFARFIEATELLVGVVLLIGALEIARRRFAGGIGAAHAYERPLALASALAGLAGAGLTLSIGILMGEGFPGVVAGRAFTSAIPIELFIVPLGIAVAWLELGRFQALASSAARAGVTY